MEEVTKVLSYFGRTMSPETVDGHTPDMVARLLTRVRGYAHVVLEPGDGTRYELHIIYRSQDPEVLLVVRDAGGRPMATFLPAWMSDYDLLPLTNSCEWTGQVLRWWFGLLFDSLATQSA